MEERKEVKAMQWELIIALVVVIPAILIPVAFVWYLNVSGIYTVIRETQKRRTARKRRIQAAIFDVATKLS